jgi:hypothetical protein
MSPDRFHNSGGGRGAAIIMLKILGSTIKKISGPR